MYQNIFIYLAIQIKMYQNPYYWNDDITWKRTDIIIICTLFDILIDKYEWFLLIFQFCT